MSKNKNIFKQVAIKRPTSSLFDLTHDVKMSGVMGNLMPCLVMDCLPGDKVFIGADALMRFAPLVAPIMHRVDLTIHYFFVPNRIIWEGFEDFITAQEGTNPAPYITVNEAATADQKKFLDYMGIPPITAGIPTSYQLNALALAAYQMIYNEYYRDENLIAKVVDTLVDGANDLADLAVMRKRAWEHDYFTASLPFAQKGAAVDIPLGEITLDPDWAAAGSEPYFDGNGLISFGAVAQGGATPAEISVGGVAPNAYNPDGSLIVNATTLNDFRRAEKLQEWLELNARGGTRYIEQIEAHFGEKGQDFRLDRPEYITGIKSPVVISEVLNTTGEDGGLPQGTMAGHGVSVAGGKIGKYHVREHGYVIGILSVMPKTCYQQGIPKHYTKLDKLDYGWPIFGNLGEQPVENKEIYIDGVTPNDVFGYVPRYSEYKYMPSRVAGDFRSTLAFWHLGRIFATQPSLNQSFIECDSEDLERVFAVQTGDNLWMHILHKLSVVRKLPFFGTPQL